LNAARVTEEDYGESVVVEFMPESIEKEMAAARKEGYFIFDPEILFLFNKKPLTMTSVRGCKQYG